MKTAFPRITNRASFLSGRSLETAFLLALLLITLLYGDVRGRLAGLIALCFWSAFKPTDDRRIKLFFCGTCIMGMIISIGPLLGISNIVTPLKYDLYLHAIDHAFGFCAPQLVMGMLLPHVFAARVVVALYEFTPAMMVAGYGWALYRNGQPNRLLLAYVASASCGFLYLIVPASGPGFLPDALVLVKPHLAPELKLIPVADVANCIPSAHLSTAILIWFFGRVDRLGRKLSFAFIFITVFATLGLGEHYLIDLVLALPFALLNISAALGKVIEAALSLAALLAWLFVIRFEIHFLVDHRSFLVFAAITTVLLPILSIRRLLSEPATSPLLSQAVTDSAV